METGNQVREKDDGEEEAGLSDLPLSFIFLSHKKHRLLSCSMFLVWFPFPHLLRDLLYFFSDVNPHPFWLLLESKQAFKKC